jgi:eukaryotic-like serine/threonine-protein kinase
MGGVRGGSVATDVSSTGARDLVAIPQPGEVIAGKYRVEGTVGSGGMGVVLAARHLQLGQAVAIKVLGLALSDERRPEAISRFFREGRAAAALQGDHVVKVHDVGVLDSGMPFMVMELLKGADLSSVLESLQSLSIEQAVECVLQAGDAIAQAHRQGIVHRDLKPSNLFVTERSDGSALIKVLDFGISKSLNESRVQGDLTTTRTVLGSPFYMSPEQVRDAKNVDNRTDVWALGAILHELLSGHPPFEADTLPGACAAIVADAPPSLRSLRADVPPEIEAIVLRCLEKEPNRRFPRVEELLSALEPFSARALKRQPPRIEIASVRLVSVVPPPIGVSAATIPTLPADASDDATLASEDVFRRPLGAESHARLRARVDAQLEAHRAASEPGGSPRRARVIGLGIGAAVVLAAVGYFLFVPREPLPAPAADQRPASVAVPEPMSFSLLIESVPSGAEVYESNERLGTTPLSLTIKAETVAGVPRVFELRREGYGSFVLMQGKASENVRRSAELVAKITPVSAPPAPAASETQPTRRAAPKAPAREQKQPAPPPPQPDIRLTR